MREKHEPIRVLNEDCFQCDSCQEDLRRALDQRKLFEEMLEIAEQLDGVGVKQYRFQPLLEAVAEEETLKLKLRDLLRRAREAK